jgi:hypothetical protein
MRCSIATAWSRAGSGGVASVDLAPAKVPNEEKGLVFEELIRRFAEQSNETTSLPARTSGAMA